MNTSKLRVSGLCAGNSPVTGEFPAQRASDAEMFPFDDVIMRTNFCFQSFSINYFDISDVFPITCFTRRNI